MQLSSFCQKNLPFLSWPNPKQTLSLAAGSSDLPWVWWSLWCRGQTGWPELEIFVSVCGRIFGRQPPASRPVYAQFYKLLSVHVSWTYLYIFSSTIIVCTFQVYNPLSQRSILLNVVIILSCCTKMSPGACRRRWAGRFRGIPHHAGRCDPRGQPPAIRGTENGWGHREKGGGAEIRTRPFIYSNFSSIFHSVNAVCFLS